MKRNGHDGKKKSRMTLLISFGILLLIGGVLANSLVKPLQYQPMTIKQNAYVDGFRYLQATGFYLKIPNDVRRSSLWSLLNPTNLPEKELVQYYEAWKQFPDHQQTGQSLFFRTEHQLGDFSYHLYFDYFSHPSRSRPVFDQAKYFAVLSKHISKVEDFDGVSISKINVESFMNDTTLSREERRMGRWASWPHQSPGLYVFKGKFYLVANLDILPTFRVHFYDERLQNSFKLIIPNEGIRMLPEVLEQTHRLIDKWYHDGKIPFDY